MLRPIRSIVKSHPTSRRLARSFRLRFRPTRSDVFRHLAHAAAKAVDDPVFVKVGANDGLTGDPFGDSLLKEAAWTGLLIEPVPYCVERLRTNYADPRRFSIHQGAVSRTSGRAPFYYVSEDARAAIDGLPSWYDQLGSFERRHIVAHLDGALEPFIRSVEVDVASLTTLLRRHGMTRVTLLNVDAEGHDLEVLRSLDLETCTPAWILIEHKHLSASDRAEMLALLKSGGYEVGDVGGDFFAMHEDAGHGLDRRGRIGRVATRVMVAADS